MNRNRNRQPSKNRFKARQTKRAKDWIKWWIYENTAFIRLNPEE